MLARGPAHVLHHARLVTSAITPASRMHFDWSTRRLCTNNISHFDRSTLLAVYFVSLIAPTQTDFDDVAVTSTSILAAGAMLCFASDLPGSPRIAALRRAARQAFERRHGKPVDARFAASHCRRLLNFPLLRRDVRAFHSAAYLGQ
jgi:hypothetical protein